MKAVFYKRQGPAEDVLQLGELDKPAPRPGEVLVQVHASGVNPSDVKSRLGLRGGGMQFPLIVPHSDGAGMIEAVGQGVATSRIGERVWIWNGQWQRSMGTASEYISLPQEQAVWLPDEIDFSTGACAGIPLMTAAHAVNLAGLEPGMTAFVSGGAGAVSQYIIQLAVRRGVRVLASCSNDQKAEMALAAGASDVVNYRTESVADFVSEKTGSRRVDRLFEVDLSANAPLIPYILRARGEIIAYGMGDETVQLPGMFMLRNAIRLSFLLAYIFTPKERAAATAVVEDALRDPKMIHTVVGYDGLSSTARAHSDVENGHIIGNAVVRVR